MRPCNRSYLLFNSHALWQCVDIISLCPPQLGRRYHCPRFVHGGGEVQRGQAARPRSSSCRGRVRIAACVCLPPQPSVTQHFLPQGQDAAHKVSQVRPNCPPAFRFLDDPFRGGRAQVAGGGSCWGLGEALPRVAMVPSYTGQPLRRTSQQEMAFMPQVLFQQEDYRATYEEG